MKTTLTKDLANKKLLVTREFAGTPEQVWQAWTDRNILDQWWAPKPWKAHTKSMDFKNGGTWLYYMQGPEGEIHYSKAIYRNIQPNHSFEGTDSFCDENGNEIIDFTGTTNWKVDFKKTENGTMVNVEIKFNSLEDLEKMIEMGFEQGFTSAHGNLDELLKK